MKQYTIHINRFGTEPEPDVRAVPEGFNWVALIFAPLWALAKGYWWVFVGIMFANIFFSGWADYFGLDLVGQAVINITINILVGFYANDLARWTLGRRGFKEEDVVSGDNREHAIECYLHSLQTI